MSAAWAERWGIFFCNPLAIMSEKPADTSGQTSACQQLQTHHVLLFEAHVRLVHDDIKATTLEVLHDEPEDVIGLREAI